tara:strand:+ start:367 stop:702 length:336 start_codon:yes stop_codon:yes gene_type:complete
MTEPVNVQDNINRLKESHTKVIGDIDKLKDQIKFAKEELIRLQGCLIVFEGFKEAGLKNIVDSSEQQKNEVAFSEPTCSINDKNSNDCGPPDVNSHNHKKLDELYAKYRTM